MSSRSLRSLSAMGPRLSWPDGCRAGVVVDGVGAEGRRDELGGAPVDAARVVHQRVADLVLRDELLELRFECGVHLLTLPLVHARPGVAGLTGSSRAAWRAQ